VLWCGAGCCVARPELVFRHSMQATYFINASKSELLSIIYSFPCNQWDLYMRKSQARLMAFSYHAIEADSISFLYVVLVCVCVCEGSWLHCSVSEGLHEHVVTIWI
jgi:hypothetical protein